MGWTETEESIISAIRAGETMHDPDNPKGDMRVKCNRAEAIRRLQRRKVRGVYVPPSKQWVLADIQLPITPRRELTPERMAALRAYRAARHAA